MADNLAVTPGSGAVVASDEATYSGDTAKIQLVRDVVVSGTEGSKTVTDKTFGAGAVAAGTPRMTLASDDPAVVSLATLANWNDGADRASVSPIVGQAGVAAGAGAVSGTTQRVVLATDVALPTGDNTVGRVGGNTATPSANFTRPADTTAYAAGDLVANSTTAGSVAPMSLTVARVAAGSGLIRRARLRKSNTSLTNASFRVHLYATTPTVTNGDNGVWLSNNVANYLGALDVTMDRAFSDGAAGVGVPLSGSDIAFKLASGQTVSALLEARAAYTPASGETFTLDLETLQD